MRNKGLTGNQLKLIALLAMSVDHVGVILLPQYAILRVIGRLAFPIYAYMIAEGCRHTRSMPRYFSAVAGMAALCQAVYLVAVNSLYQCVLVTFSISIGLICLLRYALEQKTVAAGSLAGAAVLLVLFVTQLLPGLLKGTGFHVEYGFLGVLLPVGVYFGRSGLERLGFTFAVLLLMSWDTGTVQWFSLLALPLLALYNGQRGRGKLKHFFYFYYPAHLAAIYFADRLLS